MEDLNRCFDFNAAGYVKKCPGRNQRLMERGELGRAENRRLRHKMFPEKIGMFDHGPLKRLEDYAAFLELLGNDVAMNELISGEDQTRGNLIEAARLIKDRSTFIIAQYSSELERGKIEKADIGNTPKLIFSRGGGKRLKLFPRCALLLAKPIRKIARLDPSRKNSFRAGHFINGQRRCHVDLRRKRRSADRRSRSC